MKPSKFLMVFFIAELFCFANPHFQRIESLFFKLNLIKTYINNYAFLSISILN